jgi:hypothetical protein
LRYNIAACVRIAHRLIAITQVEPTWIRRASGWATQHEAMHEELQWLSDAGIPAPAVDVLRWGPR